MSRRRAARVPAVITNPAAIAACNRSLTQHSLSAPELTLLEELSALRAQPTYEDPDGRLDQAQVSSRRVWDLLAEVRDAGLPLTWVGRSGGDVQLVTEPVRARVDVVRAPGEELLIRAHLAAGGLAVPADRHLLISGVLDAGDLSSAAPAGGRHPSLAQLRSRGSPSAGHGPPTAAGTTAMPAAEVERFRPARRPDRADDPPDALP
jgi:hypothetical protein